MTLAPPFIIDQAPDGADGVLVTWSLPGLHRATVRVPASTWIEAQHLDLGPALAATVRDVIGESVSDLTTDGDEGYGKQQDTDGADYPGDY